MEDEEGSERGRLLNRLAAMHIRLDALESLVQTLLSQVSTLGTTLNDIKHRIG